MKFILWGLLALEFLPLKNLYLIYSSHILQLGKKFIFDLFMKHFTIWYKQYSLNMKYTIENTKAVLKDFSYVEKLKINIINSFGFTSIKKNVCTQ